jgi:hypothetical protein
VELGGLEPPTPCLQTGGSTSTGIHPRSSQSWNVYPGPFGSGSVAVLSCCTHRQVPAAVQERCSTACRVSGFLPAACDERRPDVACRGVDLTLLPN